METGTRNLECGGADSVAPSANRLPARDCVPPYSVFRVSTAGCAGSRA
jgi:hypothetical protein